MRSTKHATQTRNTMNAQQIKSHARHGSLFLLVHSLVPTLYCPAFFRIVEKKAGQKSLGMRLLVHCNVYATAAIGGCLINRLLATVCVCYNMNTLWVN